VSDHHTESSEGDKKLEQIAASLDSGKRVGAVSVGELLRWFGAERRGVRINRVIRGALLTNDLRIQPDIVESRIDDTIEFTKATNLKPSRPL
jgi:hypothetical protein